MSPPKGNSLEPSKRSLPSKFAFKSYLKGISIHTPLIFNHDIPRIVQVHFTQIRMGFSNLKHDLYKKDCIEDNMCACGESKEDQRHFYLKCKRYTNERSDLFRNIKQVSTKVNITVWQQKSLYQKI